MRRPLACFAVVLLACLAACAPDAQPRLHDVYVYGLDGRDVRYGFFYGSPTTIQIDGASVALAEGAVDAPLSVRGALLVDGEPSLATPVEPIEAPLQAARIPLTTSLRVRVDADVEQVVYYDGTMWLTLLEDASAGTARRVAPRPRIGKLRGVGALTRAEADALAEHLEAQGKPLVVAELPEDALPERTIDGLAEYRATGIWVQGDLAVDPDAYEPPAERLAWEVMARGEQAVGFDAPAFRFVSNEAQLLALWNQAWGARLDVPPVPDVDFTRETVVAIFQGQQPTGGHGIEVLDVVIDDRDLFIDMRFLEPGPDAIVTQALTSPWAMVRVLRGGLGTAWFRDPGTGELLGVARRTN